MAPWKLLCCPVDFSRESRLAMEEAAALARRDGGELVLVHVDDRPAADASGSLVPPEALRRATLELERQLGDWAEAARNVVGRPVQFQLLTGAPAEEIVRLAKASGHDAIVMGTHGRAGREHLVFGSVAQAVVRDAPCTVVVVRRSSSAR